MLIVDVVFVCVMCVFDVFELCVCLCDDVVLFGLFGW